MSINSPAILGVQKRINCMQTEGINKCRNINKRNLKEKAKTEKKMMRQNTGSLKMKQTNFYKDKQR